ncbi:2TM domain-containing protein [Agarivorans aestuarii]|uniref:2TM domain-containing protein n=1 Tax=Agarivorans aestuarii TaxID=1563703 RepID=A0ABU7G5T1_9ALTE|nr:2TM domain-containing protein [Agarivorans aestuarii]MEE1674582.1 2TM domain-containing protein [Agarivorans aestuarii]
MNKSYSPQQLEQIISLGLREQQNQQNHVSEAELYDIAQQSGLDAQQTDAALKQWQHQQQQQQAQSKKLLAFKIHASSYLSICCMLFLIDWLTGGPWWFFWPMLGMGIGLLSHGLGLLKLWRKLVQPKQLAGLSFKRCRF